MTTLRIAVKNLTADGGLYTTPLWLGFHNGGFDTFNAGEAASAGLQSLAEDGSAAGLEAELSAAGQGSQAATVAGANGIIAPGERASIIADIDGSTNAYVSYAAMVLPSNDAFIGNDNALRLFSDSGAFIGAQNITIKGTDVYDAGTEVNSEIATDVPLLGQTAPNTGTDENGVVGQHPGFNGSIGNPDGAGEQNILGGTNALGEAIDPLAADFTQSGFNLFQVHINTVNQITGTDGRNRINGGGDDDMVDAGGGNDIVLGRSGWDVINGDDGHDRLFGGIGDDELNGGTGNDKLFGGRDDDLLNGGDGKDRLFGGHGNDILNGGADSDKLAGGYGNDRLDGGDSWDWLSGGYGNDILNGGSGNDWLYGGYGNDLFVFSADSGRDLLRDFRDGQDRIAIDIEGFDSIDDVLGAATQYRKSVYIDFGDNNGVAIYGTKLSSLDADDFLFTA